MLFECGLPEDTKKLLYRAFNADRGEWRVAFRGGGILPEQKTAHALIFQGVDEKYKEVVVLF